MVIAISYRPYIVAFDPEGNALNCDNNRVSNAIGRRPANANPEANNNNIEDANSMEMEEDNNNHLVVVDAEFTYQHNQYSVRRIDHERVVVASLDFDAEVEIELPRADVGQLIIREYITED